MLEKTNQRIKQPTNQSSNQPTSTKQHQPCFPMIISFDLNCLDAGPGRHRHPGLAASRIFSGRSPWWLLHKDGNARLHKKTPSFYWFSRFQPQVGMKFRCSALFSYPFWEWDAWLCPPHQDQTLRLRTANPIDQVYSFFSDSTLRHKNGRFHENMPWLMAAQSEIIQTLSCFVSLAISDQSTAKEAVGDNDRICKYGCIQGCTQIHWWIIMFRFPLCWNMARA